MNQADFAHQVAAGFRDAQSMAEVTATPGGGGSWLPSLGQMGDLLRRGDLSLAIGVMTILVVLLLPLPPLLLDFALAISIILSVLIVMTALFIHTPLEFSAFPTVLPISMLLRLSLNLASTRLILAHGHEGRVLPAMSSRRSAISSCGQFHHRGHCVHDPGDREFRGDHQGLGTHRGSRGTLQPRRHAGKIDGDRRRSFGRSDR
jgi:hypothetical protein